MSDLLSPLASPTTAAEPERPATVLVVDYGAQYAQLIARRVREARVYSEIVPHSVGTDAILARQPAAIILSGGPASVYEMDAASVDRRLFEAGIPVFGICYGFQAMAQALGGQVARTDRAEFGRTEADVEEESRLFTGQPKRQTVWMSHRDSVVGLPDGFTATAETPGASVAAFEDPVRSLCGVQWHPEVMHSTYGQRVLERFLYDYADIDPSWTTDNIIEATIQSIADTVGTRNVICGLSGGVDSAVAAALVQRAVGSQLTCVFVDHGLLREGERTQVEGDYVKATGINLKTVPARERFLDALANVAEPEAKRRTIGREFIRVFEEAAAGIVIDNGVDEIEFLVQGTLYPDVVESGSGEGAATIKSHHNVGGLPPDVKFELIEPLRRLFKDEVRSIGYELGLPKDIVGRQPFPGPGLAIRIIGVVTAERLQILRRADSIVREELTAAGLDDAIWQCPVVLLADVRSVGVQGDGRTYGHPIVLRPVTSEDAMTADWAQLPYDVVSRISNRITNDIEEVNRVVLDVTSKPPGTIEWE
ncbi:MAG: glutamine-hydrolyzing GMP synthase [Actinomycetota bacterium]|nr:glutamine-hydrolyzing GMP synthase [Actinomycetota bacterium]